jgi:hypothetical protein
MPHKTKKVKTEPLTAEKRERADNVLLNQGWLYGWITDSVRITVLQDLKSKEKPKSKTNGPVD